MRRKRKMNVVSVWIIVIFTVIAVTLVSLFMMVYSFILKSEEQATLREQVEVLRDNADNQVVDVIQNQLARRLATLDTSTGYINALAEGHIPSVEEIRTLAGYFEQVRATQLHCERVELYFPSSSIVIGSQGIQYLADRKYSSSTAGMDYMRTLYPADCAWLKRAVSNPSDGSTQTFITYLRIYPGVFPAGMEPMLAISIEENNFLALLRASMRTLESDASLMLVDLEGLIWSAEADENADKEGRTLLAGENMPAFSAEPVTLSNGQRGLIMEAASASGAWYYALLRPAAARVSSHGTVVSVWAVLCVLMLFVGLATVLQVMMKHYDKPMQRLVKSLSENEAEPSNASMLSLPSEHFMQIESALSDMNKLRQEREHFMTHNQPLLRQSWLNCFIQGEAYYNTPHPQLGIDFPYPHFQVVITSVTPSEQEVELIRAAFQDDQWVMETFESREKETVLLFNHPYDENALAARLEKLCDQLDEMGSALVFGVGLFSVDDKLVAASFRCARRALSARYFEKGQRVCVFDPAARHAEAENALSQIISQLTELTSLIRRESQEDVDHAIDSIVTQLKETTPYLNTMRSIMLLAAMYLSKVVYDMKGAPEEVYGENLLNAYYHLHDISEFSQRLKRDSALLRRYLSQESSPGNRSVVQYAIHHIRNSAPADLSIHSIADAIGISTGHLSRMFHQETGRKLVDYLQEVRMEHAARLLTEGRMTNEEICECIGYSRLQYFASKFKEHYGLTLNEYRRKNQYDQPNAENREN